MLSYLPFHHSQSFQSSKRHQRSLNQEQQQLWFLTNFLGNVETIKEVSFQDMQFTGVIHLFNGPFARNGHIWNKKPYWKEKDAEGSSRTRGGPLGPGRPIFRPNGGPKGPQFFFFKTAPPPLSQGLDDRAPLCLKVWIRHWRGRKNRGYTIHKANILFLLGPTTLFAIQQGGFCTLDRFVQGSQ